MLHMQKIINCFHALIKNFSVTGGARKAKFTCEFWAQVSAGGTVRPLELKLREGTYLLQGVGVVKAGVG